MPKEPQPLRAKQRYLKTIRDQKATIATQTAEIKRLEKELGFQYGKRCPCGNIVWVIPSKCKDGSA